MEIEVTVDITKCAGTMTCMNIAKDSFFSKDGVAYFQFNDNQDRKQIIFAAECCPLGAITVKERETNNIIFP